MRRRLLAAALVAAFGLAAGPVLADASDPPPPSSPDRKAAEGVALIKRLAADGGDFRSMGFANRQEVQLARLGPSMPVFNIDLDALRAYHPGVPTSALLRRSSETVYLVLVRGQPKSSVSVVRTPRGPRLYALGEAVTPLRLKPYLRAGRGQQFIVRAPALDGLFLGWTAANGRILVINLVNEPDLPLPIGQTFPAERALAELSKVARQVPLEPRPSP